MDIPEHGTTIVEGHYSRKNNTTGLKRRPGEAFSEYKSRCVKAGLEAKRQKQQGNKDLANITPQVKLKRLGTETSAAKHPSFKPHRTDYEAKYRSTANKLDEEHKARRALEEKVKALTEQISSVQQKNKTLIQQIAQSGTQSLTTPTHQATMKQQIPQLSQMQTSVRAPPSWPHSRNTSTNSSAQSCRA